MLLSDEKGPLGILPRGPIRKALFEDGTFKDRKFYGIVMKDAGEARTFRRNAAAAVVSTATIAAYLGIILARLPPVP